MRDQRDDRDDWQNVNQASADMKYESAKEPGCLGSMADTHDE
jgi:hypothetical protein